VLIDAVPPAPPPAAAEPPPPREAAPEPQPTAPSADGLDIPDFLCRGRTTGGAS
jgi:hypothetical protein